MFKNTIIPILLVCSPFAWSQSSSLNLAIPSSPQSYQSDRFRAGDLDCSMAIGSSTNVEFGVVGIIDKNSDPFQTYPDNFVMGQQETNVGVYAKITIPIGAPKERINCNVLYKLELEKRRLEVQRLKAEIEQLRSLQFENK